MQPQQLCSAHRWWRRRTPSPRRGSLPSRTFGKCYFWLYLFPDAKCTISLSPQLAGFGASSGLYRLLMQLKPNEHVLTLVTRP